MAARNREIVKPEEEVDDEGSSEEVESQESESDSEPESDLTQMETETETATATATEMQKKSMEFVWSALPLPLVDNNSLSEKYMLKTGRELFESGRGLEGESRWKELRVEEIKIYLRLLEVRRAQTALVIEKMSARFK